MSQDPPRLLDDPGLPRELARDLGEAARTPSQAHDPAAGLAALRAAIDATSTSATATSATAAGATSAAGGGGLPLLAIGLGALVALGLAVGAGTWMSDREVAPTPTTPAPPSFEGDPAAAAHPAEPATRSAEPASAAPEAIALAPSPPAEPQSPQEPQAPAEPQAPTEPQAAAPREPRRAAPSPALDPDELLRRETAQLARIRGLLEPQPAEALRLAEAGQREFRSGMFGEEREALAILALERLGRRDAVARRGARFLRQHPSGPFSGEIRQLVDRP